jgi:hypothetical protein
LSYRFPAQPTADQAADLVEGLGGEPVACRTQTLLVFRQAELKAKYFKSQVCPFQQFRSLPRVLGLNQRLQLLVHSTLDALAQDKALVTRKAVGVIDQIVRLCDDDQLLLLLFHRRPPLRGELGSRMLLDPSSGT